MTNLNRVGIKLECAGHEEGGPAIVDDDGKAPEEGGVGQLGHVAPLVHQRHG